MAMISIYYANTDKCMCIREYKRIANLGSISWRGKKVLRRINDV